MKIAAVIPAAGKSVRMGTHKQLMILKDRPVLTHTLAIFENHSEVQEIIVVASTDIINEIKSNVINPYGFSKIKAVVEGKATRQESVWVGIKALSPDTTGVLIHDGARPLVSTKAISDVIAFVKQGICAVSGVKSKDTIKITNSKNIVQDTPDRTGVWIVQTPQGFPVSLIKEAHKQAAEEGFLGTDDAMIVERMGVAVRMTEGNYHNIKLTTPEDIRVAEALFSQINITIT
ncbi:MAG: 2-C-methyl-D-erythritol 4-phosphate cytidylyltransferase [Defluviitaleaceae bacterium]|nr:2-C-methyl-D-erythritol 4-phosphate cytidylyltransferase [Defluviitaleaceae bacterium]